MEFNLVIGNRTQISLFFFSLMAHITFLKVNIKDGLICLSQVQTHLQLVEN